MTVPLFLICLLSVTASSQAYDYWDASAGDYPYVVRMKSDVTYCGGTLLTLERFVTAGHCLYIVDPATNKLKPEKFLRKFAVYAGHVFIFSSSMQAREIKKAYIHPNFRANPDNDYFHNIALVDVSSPFKKTSHLQPINLLDEVKLKSAWNTVYNNNMTCRTVGWSKSIRECKPNENNKMYLRFLWKDLQMMEVKPTIISTCKKYTWTGEDMNSTGKVCTTASNFYEGPCGGDPGTPLICDGQPLGVHITNLVCTPHEIVQLYQLFWPYMSSFPTASGFVSL